MRKLWIFLGISSFLCDFSTCSLAMGLGSRLSPWNLGLSSSQAATCNSSTQQRHASARFEPQKNIPSVENLEGYWNSWETHHVTYPTNQPTNQQYHNISEASAAKQRKVTSNVRPVWPSKCGVVVTPTSSGSSVGPTARGVGSPGRNEAVLLGVDWGKLIALQTQILIDFDFKWM